MASIKLKGDTSGEVTISAPAVAGTTTLTLPATSSTLATQNALGVRNLIINGDMRIAQRGTSAAGLTNGSNGYYTVDRWKFQEAGAPTYAVTMSQDTDVPSGQGFSNSVKYDITTAQASLAAADGLLMPQMIEGQMLQHIKKGTSSAESLTLSFWVKSNKTGTYIFELEDADNARNISKSYTIDAADTWEKKTITIDADTTGTLDNDNAASFKCWFWFAAGSNFTSGTLATSWASVTTANRAVGQVNLADSTSNYINITGVQLEVGDTATPFEHRPYDMELARCQRYYKNIFHGQFCGVVYEPNGDTRTTVLQIGTMRASPTITPSSYSAHSLNLGPSGTLVNTPTATWNLTVIHAGNNFYSLDTNQSGSVSYTNTGNNVVVGVHGAGTILCDAEL